jgi:hypothetical protein
VDGALDALLKTEAHLSVLQLALAIWIERESRKSAPGALDSFTKELTEQAPLREAQVDGAEQQAMAKRYTEHLVKGLARFQVRLGQLRFAYLGAQDN